MRDILIGAASIAAGICLAVAIIVATWHVLRPPQKVTVSLGEYSCATDGRAITCSRK